MTEKDLDIAIEKCERIMEMDARTMQNPVSENGWIFEKVYELLQYLRQFQFATDTNVGDTISRKAAIDAVRKAKDKSEAHRMLVQLPPAQPGCEDVVPRTSVEYICRKNTVSTNPYEHKYHDKFIQFMDDPEIYDFGRWQHSNGFNTALVAVECDLDKVPSVTPKQPGWIPCSERLPDNDIDVLVTDGTDCAVAYWRTDAQAWDDSMHGWCDLYGLEVTAWMPLPKPWEGGQDENN